MKVVEEKLTIPLEEAEEIVDSFAQHIGHVAVANIKDKLRRLAETQVECNVYWPNERRDGDGEQR